MSLLPLILSTLAAIPLGSRARTCVSSGTWRTFQVGLIRNDQNGYLEIVDVTNPASPQRVGGYTAEVDVSRVQVIGKTVYLTYGGLEILDVSDPAKPSLVGIIQDFGEDVHVVGNLAYGLGNGLQIWDITNPATPSRLSSIPAKGRWLDVAGRLAVAAGALDLEVFDVSDPAKPVRLSGRSLRTWANRIHLNGSHAYIAEGEDLHINGIEIFDVSDPVRPVRVGTYGSWDFGHSEDVQVVGNLAYLAAGLDGLKILDLHQLAPPRLRISQNESKPALQLSGFLGASYTIEYGTSLPTANWIPLPAVKLTNNPQVIIDPDATKFPQRFYRAVVR